MMQERQALAKRLLISSLNALKENEKIEGFAIMWLEEIIELTFLSDFEDIMAEALSLRTSNNIKLGDPMSGAITNIKRTDVIADYDWPKDRIELEKKYGYDRVTDFLKICEQSKEGSLFVKKREDLEAAIKLAKDDFDLETIACFLCVNGHFDSAENMIENELSRFDNRILVVKTVMCIECFRKNQFQKAKAILDDINSEGNNIRANLFFARGILNYEPWEGYPFSDY